jgi:hypothetical protein
VAVSGQQNNNNSGSVVGRAVKPKKSPHVEAVLHIGFRLLAGLLGLIAALSLVGCFLLGVFWVVTEVMHELGGSGLSLNMFDWVRRAGFENRYELMALFKLIISALFFGLAAYAVSAWAKRKGG